MTDKDILLSDLNDISEILNNNGYGGWCSTIRKAIELLKEKEAVKPKSKSRHGEYPQIVHRCGNCNEILYKYYKYCPTCGRAVKWE